MAEWRYTSCSWHPGSIFPPCSIWRGLLFFFKWIDTTGGKESGRCSGTMPKGATRKKKKKESSGARQGKARLKAEVPKLSLCSPVSLPVNSTYKCLQWGGGGSASTPLITLVPREIHLLCNLPGVIPALWGCRKPAGLPLPLPHSHISEMLLVATVTDFLVSSKNQKWVTIMTKSILDVWGVLQRGV